MAASFGVYQRAGEGDVRSPCPGLNALANHGIIPRDGKNVPILTLIKAMETVFNFDRELAKLFALGALIAADHPASAKLDLNQLNKHNIIEHDVSLSRADLGDQGDNHSFNQTLFDHVLEHYNGMEYTTIEAAAKARYYRYQEEKKEDKNFTYGLKEFILSYGETALYLQAMGDASTSIAKVAHVKIFFEEERLPYEEGWLPSKTPISGSSINAAMAKLLAVTDEVIHEGQSIDFLTVLKDSIPESSA